MSIQIPCPNCGRKLKLPDRSLLGRKGKCPQCAHTFILEEPPVVTLELMDSAETLARSASEGSSRTPGTIPKKETPVPSQQPDPSVETAVSELTFPPELAALDRIANPKGAAARLKELQKTNRRRRNIGLALTGIILAAVAGVAVVAPHFAARNLPVTTSNSSADSTSSKTADSGESVPADGADQPSPTRGKPIELQYIPFGTQVVLNLRPAELWKAESLGEEIRFCAPELAQFIEKTLFDLFQRKPDQVEELLICLLPGMRGTLPDVAAVAHMVDDQKRSQLIEQFGTRDDAFAQPVYYTDQRAYMIVDQRTLVVCPKSQAQEMVDAITARHPAETIDPLLPFTDRDRHFTVMFTPQTLTLQESWFPLHVLPIIQNSVGWLGEEIQTLAWSFHLTEEEFFSEILVQGKGISGKSAIVKLEQELQNKLAHLAEFLVPHFQQMNPREQGKRMLIGRVPAMVEVYAMATEFTHGPQYVRLVTSLPDVAGPNLVLGSIQAWEESTRTDFTKTKPVPAETAGPKIPDLVADRLRMKIDVDFRRTPLNEAFAFISAEIRTPIEIDGDALKLGGFTKNIAQAFKMDATPVKDIVLKIFADSKGIDPKPEKTLVVVVDESKKSLLITTLATASESGLKPYELTK